MRIIRQKCWKCGGKGWLHDHLMGIGTLGLGYLVAAVDGLKGAKEGRKLTKLCPICEGKGYLDGTEGSDWHE